MQVVLGLADVLAQAATEPEREVIRCGLAICKCDDNSDTV